MIPWRNLRTFRVNDGRKNSFLNYWDGSEGAAQINEGSLGHLYKIGRPFVQTISLEMPSILTWTAVRHFRQFLRKCCRAAIRRHFFVIP